jgi:GNAT superfamily N-acetyltransferase
VNDEKYSIGINTPVGPKEILAVRGEPSGQEELWRKCVDGAMCVVSARDVETRQLVGIGFLVGNHRHAQLADLVVHHSARKNGVGGRIFDALVRYAREQQITYIGLTWDKKSPWLKDFYARHGFREIDFAMWEEHSLAATQKSVKS